MTRRLFLVCTVVLMSMSVLTFLFGLVMTPPQHVYTGLHGIAPGDVLVYYSYLEQVRQGAFTFHDLFTGESQPGNLVLPIWFGVGLIGRVLHTPPQVTYHLVRVLSIPLLMAAIAAAVQCFLRDKRQQRFAFFLAVFAGGLGFLVGPIEQQQWGRDIIEHLWPMDLWVSEGFSYLSAIQSPHFILGTALLLFFIVEMVRTLERGVTWRTLAAGAGGAVVVASTPFLVVLMAPLTLLALTFSHSTGTSFWQRCLRLFALWFPTFPALVYVGLYQAFDTFARARATQNILITPVWWVTLASYGLLLPLALWGARQVWRDRSWRTRLLLGWFALQPILFYGPVFFQRRLVQGWQFPLASLAAVGAEALFYRSPLARWGRVRTSLAALVLVLLLGSPLYQLANDLSLMSQARGSDFSALYVPRTLFDGYDWLKKNTTSDALIFADSSYAPFITAFSGRRSFVGHGVETLHYDEKRTLARDVVRGVYNAQDLQHLALQQGWTHVWASPVEQHFGFDLKRYPFLTSVYTSGDLTITAVTK